MPHSPHVIRLHGPWNVAKIDGSDNLFSFTRRFGCPTNLEPSEKVFLVCDLSEWLEKISLNGSVIGEKVNADEVFRLDITDQLQSRNELVIEVIRTDEHRPMITTLTQKTHWDTAGSLVGVVRLEISNTNAIQ
jgi:hypothetical protein